MVQDQRAIESLFMWDRGSTEEVTFTYVRIVDIIPAVYKTTIPVEVPILYCVST